MENPDLLKSRPDAGKSLIHQPGIFVGTSTIANEFPVMQICNQTDVVPSAGHPYVSQVTDDDLQVLPVVELPGHLIADPLFIGWLFGDFVLSHCIIGNQSQFLHNPADPPAGDLLAFFFQYRFDFPGSIVPSAGQEDLFDGVP